MPYSLYIWPGKATEKLIFGSSVHWKFATVRKLGQSSIHTTCQSWFQRFDFAGFFRSVMAFTPKLTLAAAWLTSGPSSRPLRSLSMLKKRPKSSQQLREFSVKRATENQLCSISEGPIRKRMFEITVPQLFCYFGGVSLAVFYYFIG